MDEALLSRIEDTSLNASAPPQQRWLDGWIVRYSPGKARRARCVNAVATGRLPLAHKLQLAGAVFAAAELPMVVRITRFTQPGDLDAQLESLGLRKLDITRVQVKSVLTQHAPPPLPTGTHWVRLEPADFAELVGALRGSTAAQRQAHAERLHFSPVPYVGYAIRRNGDGEVLTCGQFAREAELVGLYDVFTRESVRGQGLAGLLCERLLSLASNDGAQVAYLQVESGNEAALRVYAKLGFVDGYTYHYREPPAP